MNSIFLIEKAFLELDGIEELEKDVNYESFWWRFKEQSIVVRRMTYDSFEFVPLCREHLLCKQAGENLEGLYQKVKERISHVRIEKKNKLKKHQEEQEKIDDCINNFLKFVREK